MRSPWKLLNRRVCTCWTNHLIEIAARWLPSGTMVLFVLLNLNALALKIVQRDTHAGQIIDALCSYHEPTRRCLDRALTRWGNRRGPCGNGSSMRSWVRVALSGGVLPAFLPAAGLPCPPSSFSWAGCHRRGRKGGPFGKMGAPAVRFFHGEPRTPADGTYPQAQRAAAVSFKASGGVMTGSDEQAA